MATSLDKVSLGKTRITVDDTGTETKAVTYTDFHAVKKQLFDKSVNDAYAQGYQLTARLEVILPLDYEPDRTVKFAIYHDRKMIIKQLTPKIGSSKWTLVLAEKVIG